MEKNLQIYIYISESLCCDSDICVESQWITLETLKINYASVKKKPEQSTAPRKKIYMYTCKCISSVQSLSCIWLLVTPWTIARQASLSVTNSQTLLKLMFIESVMPSNHLILCRPLLSVMLYNHLILSSPFPSVFNLSQHQSLFQWVSSSHQVVKVL